MGGKKRIKKLTFGMEINDFGMVIFGDVAIGLVMDNPRRILLGRS